MYDGMKT